MSATDDEATNHPAVAATMAGTTREHMRGLGKVTAYLTGLVVRCEVDPRVAQQLARAIRAETDVSGNDADPQRVALRQALSRFDAEINRAKAAGFVNVLAGLRDADRAREEG